MNDQEKAFQIFEVEVTKRKLNYFSDIVKENLNAFLEKGLTPQEAVDAAFEQFELFEKHKKIINQRDRLDVFADEKLRAEIGDKVAVIGESPERIVGLFGSLADALEFIREQKKPCRIVQGLQK